MEWGQKDEGFYHWAGQAKNYDSAVRKACAEMDECHNENYALEADGSYDKDMLRGRRAGEPTTEYAVADCAVDVNEFAATEMLNALRAVQRIMGGALSKNRELFDQVEKAVAAGEGRD